MPINPDRIRSRLGPILAAELERLEITVTELSRRSGLPVMSCHDYVSGTSEPSLSRVLALERALQRRPGWLSRQVSE